MTPPDEQDYPVPLLSSLEIRRQRVQKYEHLCRAGYTELLVFMVQQILHFESLGKEFAMRHRGAEDEMLEVLEDLFASMPLERRLRCLTIEERLSCLTLEDRLRGLIPGELERIKELAEQMIAKHRSAPK